jgi:hypothetical protein
MAMLQVFILNVCHDGLPGMCNGMGTSMVHRARWDASLHAASVGRRHGKLRPDGLPPE